MDGCYDLRDDEADIDGGHDDDLGVNYLPL